MNTQDEQFSPKIRLWRYVPVLLILGLAVHLLIPQITTLQDSWFVVKGMIWWAVIFAMVAQICSYLGSGFVLHSILDNNQERLSTLRGALITMASASIGLVAGGWVGAAAATYGWVRHESRDGKTATLAGTLPALLNNAVLASVALIGTIYLLVLHDLTRMQLIEFGLVLLVICLMMIGIVVGLRSPEMTIRFAVWLAERWAKVIRKPFEPRKSTASVMQFVNAWNSLSHGKWKFPLLGAVANIGFDMLTLYFMFIAAGYNVNLGILFAGYGLPFMLGKVAFMFPGGVGVIDGGMVAMYESLKVPNEISVVVILGYRLLSFWLPSLLGFAASAFLSRKPSA